MGLQATTLRELMIVRAFHSKLLHRFSLGTSIGFRIRRYVLTDIPAILVFVTTEVQWLNPAECLPSVLRFTGACDFFFCFSGFMILAFNEAASCKKI